jgi:hypothetical protein
MNIDKIFYSNRPSGFTGNNAKQVLQLIDDLCMQLVKEMRQLKFNTIKLTGNDLNELACQIIEFVEDIYCGTGLWQSYEKYNKEYFGIPLPPFFPPEENINNGNVITFERIRHFLFLFYEEMIPELTLSPYHQDMEYLSKAVLRFLEQNSERIPRDSVIREFLSQPVREAGDVKKKLIWLGTHSCLFRLSFRNYVKENGNKISISLIDDFICQANTRLSGLGVIDIMAKTLNITDKQRNELRGWYERYLAIYKIAVKSDNMLKLQNVINGAKYEVNAGDYVSSFKAGEIVFGSLIRWDNVWYWSGEQQLFGVIPGRHLEEMRNDFLKKTGTTVYRYDKKNLAKAKKRVKEHRKDFVKHFGADFVIFADGLEMASAMQKKERLKYESEMSKSKLNKFKKKHNLKNTGPDFSYPEQLLESVNGLGVFFNPNEGLEIALNFNDVLSGFKKRGDNLDENEMEAIRLFIQAKAISPEFVKRMIREYGADSIIASFLVRNCNKKIVVEYLLRKHKGHFYRNRYPAISFVE